MFIDSRICDRIRPGSRVRVANGLSAWAAVAMVAGACGAPAKPVARETTKRPRLCTDKPAAIEQLIRPGAFTVFGEIHGTNEVPAFVGNLACHAARVAPLVVGLEVPASFGHAIDTFLASAGHPQDRHVLLNHSFWKFRPQLPFEALYFRLCFVRALFVAAKGGHTDDDGHAEPRCSATRQELREFDP